MAWIDTDYVDNMLGSSTLRQRLFAVDTVYSSGAFDQSEASARAFVTSYIMYAGYPDPGTTLPTGEVSTAFLQDLTACLMVSRAFSRSKGIQWPQGLQDSVTASLAQLDAIYERRLPVPGLTPSEENGFGGVLVSSSSETASNGRPQRFSRSQLKTWGV